MLHLICCAPIGLLVLWKPLAPGVPVPIELGRFLAFLSPKRAPEFQPEYLCTSWVVSMWLGISSEISCKALKLACCLLGGDCGMWVWLLRLLAVWGLELSGKFAWPPSEKIPEFLSPQTGVPKSWFYIFREINIWSREARPFRWKWLWDG